MIDLIISLIILLASPQQPQSFNRGLAPIPEPEVQAAPIERVYLPLVVTHTPLIEGADTTLYGYATPHRRSYNVSYYNWRAIPDDCENEHFWPMVRGQAVDPEMVEACDNGRRWLLAYNEPEMTHFSATPEEAALFVRDWNDRWSGPIACCGNFYHKSENRDGLEWFLDFVYESGGNPQIDAIHIHVYAVFTMDVDRMEEWRTLADNMGIPLFVTEAGIFTSEDYLPEEVAEALPGFLTQLEEYADMIIWFSDYLQPWALGGNTAWHNFNLTEIDGELTAVGRAWELFTGRTISTDRR